MNKKVFLALLEHSKINLEGIGAFKIVKRKSQLDKETNALLPPGVDIDFTQKLNPDYPNFNEISNESEMEIKEWLSGLQSGLKNGARAEVLPGFFLTQTPSGLKPYEYNTPFPTPLSVPLGTGAVKGKPRKQNQEEVKSPLFGFWATLGLIPLVIIGIIYFGDNQYFTVLRQRIESVFEEATKGFSNSSGNEESQKNSFELNDSMEWEQGTTFKNSLADSLGLTNGNAAGINREFTPTQEVFNDNTINQSGKPNDLERERSEASKSQGNQSKNAGNNQNQTNRNKQNSDKRNTVSNSGNLSLVGKDSTSNLARTNTSVTNESSSNTAEYQSARERRKTRIYAVVNQSFVSFHDARDDQNKLMSQGYRKQDILEKNQRFFTVFRIFSTKDEAEEYIQRIQEKFPEAKVEDF